MRRFLLYEAPATTSAPGWNAPSLSREKGNLPSEQPPAFARRIIRSLHDRPHRNRRCRHDALGAVLRCGLGSARAATGDAVAAGRWFGRCGLWDRLSGLLD